MPLKIEKIAIKQCGPLSNLSIDFSTVNLVYSENEKGKSYLVEFIIHSLFKNKVHWSDLRQPGQGKVVISGFDNKPSDFTPSSKKKIEDHLEKQQKGLPPSLSNLLIVKEGETEIVKNSCGIDKKTLKEILSPRRVLNQIESKITATLKGAKIEDGQINIKKQGEGKDYIETKEKITQIEGLIKQLINEYEQGEIRNLQLRKEELSEAKQLLLKAKRYEAYILNEKLNKLKREKEKFSDYLLDKLKQLLQEHKNLRKDIEKLEIDLKAIGKQTQRIPELEREKETLQKARKYEAYKISINLKDTELQLKKITDEDISDIQQAVIQYGHKVAEISDKLEILNKLKEQSKDYYWLKAAKENYLKFISSPLKTDKATSLLPYLSAFLILVGILMIFLEQKISASIVLVASGLFATYYMLKTKKSFTSFKKSEELKTLREEFAKKFGKEPENLTDFEELLYEQEKSYFNLDTYEREIERLNTELLSLKHRIEDFFNRMGINGIDENKWTEKIAEIRNEREELKAKAQQLRGKLEELGIEESDYEIKDPGVKFNKKEWDEKIAEISGLIKLREQEYRMEEQRELYEKRLVETKKQIEEIFKNDLNIDLEETEWTKKVEEIEKERKQIEKELNEIEGLLKGLGVSENEFIKENPNIKFSPQDLEKIDRELSELEEHLKSKSQELERLRARIIQFTGIDISTSWNEMIEKVYLKRKELLESLEDTEAKIIAGIMVHETIQELQREEDEKLMEKINTPEITRLIEKITGRYKSLSFTIPSSEHESSKNQEDIIINDEFSSFNLSDLSTGAKEQIMIALRIGLAKNILKGEPAFLILDDAFQHSDYKKRPLLVETLFELAREGWQIIYLTMDDHIRELFKLKSSNLELGFKEISL